MYKIITQNRDGRSSYGIEHIGSGRRIEDITVQRSDINGLVEKMNQGKLAPEHMLDVAEDFLIGTGGRSVKNYEEICIICGFYMSCIFICL